MVVLQTILFLFTLFVVVLIHQLGHLIALERLGITVRRFSVGLVPIKTFKLKRFSPFVTFEIGAVPIGVWKEISRAGKAGFKELSLSEKAFYYCAGAMATGSSAIMGHIVYLLAHTHVLFRGLTIVFGLVLLGFIFLMRREVGKWFVPMFWGFFLLILSNMFARGEIEFFSAVPDFPWLFEVFVRGLRGPWDVLILFNLSSGLCALVSIMPLPFTDGGHIFATWAQAFSRRRRQTDKLSLSQQHLHKLRTLSE
jgi:membrane-associated protease RseP (regulator of RpoE activity)